MTIQEQAEAQARREALQRQINQNKVQPIDRTYYHKTDQDKAKLYNLKKAWEARVADGYIVNKFTLAGSDTMPASYYSK